MTESWLEAKYLGGMLGSAIGDAMGELAFQYPDRDKLITVAEGVTELSYTDDTLPWQWVWPRPSSIKGT